MSKSKSHLANDDDDDWCCKKHNFSQFHTYKSCFCRKIIDKKQKFVKSILKERNKVKSKLKVSFVKEGSLKESLQSLVNSNIKPDRSMKLPRARSNRNHSFRRKRGSVSAKSKPNKTLSLRDLGEVEESFSTFSSFESPTICLSSFQQPSNQCNNTIENENHFNDKYQQDSVSNSDLSLSPDCMKLNKKRRRRSSITSSISLSYISPVQTSSSIYTDHVFATDGCPRIENTSKHIEVNNPPCFSHQLNDVNQESVAINNDEIVGSTWDMVGEEIDEEESDCDDSGFLCSFFDPL